MQDSPNYDTNTPDNTNVEQTPEAEISSHLNTTEEIEPKNQRKSIRTSLFECKTM